MVPELVLLIMIVATGVAVINIIIDTDHNQVMQHINDSLSDRNEYGVRVGRELIIYYYSWSCIVLLISIVVNSLVNIITGDNKSTYIRGY